MTDPSPTQSSSPPWRYIPLAAFSPPSAAPSSALRTATRQLLRRMVLRFRSQEEFQEMDLRSAPTHLLSWVAPEPRWESAGQGALATVLADWMKQDPSEAGIRTIVCSPAAVTRPALLHWAEQNELTVIEPPTLTQILEADQEWVDQWPLDNEHRLVLPRLERCFLRHHNGLTLLRRLMDHLWNRRPPLIVMCESWAWLYLRRALHIEALLAHPVTLAPFDEEQLALWLRQIALQRDAYTLTFRQSNNGRPVLETGTFPSPLPLLQVDEREKHSDFLKQLAIASRGNPGVAWTIWRHSLHVTVGDEVEEKAKAAAESDARYTIWVRPWNEIDLPAVPSDASKIEAFVLHALLLHGGLPHSLLAQFLPFTASEVAFALHRLHLSDLVEEKDGSWRVRALGYPSVRSFLNQEGFPLDPL